MALSWDNSFLRAVVVLPKVRNLRRSFERRRVKLMEEAQEYYGYICEIQARPGYPYWRDKEEVAEYDAHCVDLLAQMRAITEFLEGME